MANASVTRMTCHTGTVYRQNFNSCVLYAISWKFVLHFVFLQNDRMVRRSSRISSMGAARHGVVWKRTHALLLHRQMASSQCKTVAMSNLKCRKYQLYLSWVGHDFFFKKKTLLKTHRVNLFYRQNSDKRHVRAHIMYQFYFRLLNNIKYT